MEQFFSDICLFFNAELAGVAVKFYFFALFGSWVLYFALRSAGKRPIEFLQHILGRAPRSTFENILEIIFFTAAGCILGTILVRPINEQQAIIAGLSWVGILGSFVSKKKENDTNKSG